MVRTWGELFEVARNLDWCVTYETKDLGALYAVDFAKYSPAGEDFSFYCEANTPEEMAHEVLRYSTNFDIDEHVKSVMEMCDAPSLRELVHDAEDIASMVEELYDAINNYQAVQNLKSGDRVELINHGDNDALEFEPEIGTIGVVLSADAKYCKVQWPRNSTGRLDDRLYVAVHQLKKCC